MKTPAVRVSVIVPVRNAAGTIDRCLDSLQRLAHDSYEVIVVDDGSSDDTAARCEASPGVTVLRVEHGGPARARNLALESAAGDLVAFTDGDCVVDSQWLAELERGFGAPEIVGVGGDQRSPDDDSQLGKRVQEFFKAIGFIGGYIKTHTELVETEHNPSCSVMYRKAIIYELGGFDESLFPGEDVDLDYRLTRSGFKLLYNPRAWVAHYRVGTLRGLARMMIRYGDSQWRLVRKHGFFRLLHWEPVFFVACLAALIGAFVWSLKFGVLLLLAFAVLLLGWFRRKSSSLGRAAQLFFLFAMTLLFWNLGFFTAVFRGHPAKIARARSNLL